jgi:excisionase family DNA binding protein
LNPRPSDSKCLQEPSTGLFSPSQWLTIDNEGSGIHEVNHSNPSKASQTLAAETKIFAALVLHASGLHAVGSPDALLTVRDVAAILRVSRDTVYTLCTNGELPHIRVLNAIRISAHDLEDFVLASKRGSPFARSTTAHRDSDPASNDGR